MSSLGQRLISSARQARDIVRNKEKPSVILNPEQKLECLRLAKELRPLGHTSAEQLVKDAETLESFVSGQMYQSGQKTQQDDH